jgi:hypothetical protein
MTAIYELRGPDGKVYEGSGPDGMTEEEVRRQIIKDHPHLKDYDPELGKFDPHEEQGVLERTGGAIKRAGEALPGSIKSNVEEIGGSLWTIMSDPKAAGKALVELGPSGIGKEIWDDLVKHYDGIDRIQKTIETDPARFIMDAASVASLGAGAVRKIVIGIARAMRGAIAPVAGKLTGVGAETLRKAGEAGAAGGQPAAQFRAGLGGAVAGARPYQAAGETIGQAGWLPPKFKNMSPFAGGVTGGGVGVALGEALASGHIPLSLTAATTAAGTSAISSPRLMGETMYGLGAAERGMRRLPLTRTAISAGALSLLRDQLAKKDLSNDDIKTLRKAKRSDAGSATLMAASQILQRPRVSTGPAPSSYGGVGGEQSVDATQATAQTPSPGESSAPPEGRQEGGPVAEGQPYTTGEAGPETLIDKRGARTVGAQGPETIVPDQPGMVVPKQETSFLQKVWDAFITPAQAGEKEDPIVKTIMQHPVLQMGVGPGMVGAQRGGAAPMPGPANLNIPKAAQPGMATLGKFFESFPGAKPRLGVVPPAAAPEPAPAPAPAPRTPEPTSAPAEHALSVNEILSPKTPALFEPYSRNVEDIAKGLHDRGQTALKQLGIREGKITAENRTPETDALLARTLASEAKEALQRTGHAGDWYTTGVNEAVQEAAKLYPEIKTDPNARLAFRAAKAITSQSETVPSNVRLTDQVYSYFRENGRFPTNVKAEKQKAINNNFKKLNGLIETMGTENMAAFLDKEFTVRELKGMGFKVPGGWPMDHKVYGSAILGPKIGNGFFQNLGGNFKPVTTDLWLMRTWGRLTGTLHGMPQAVPKARSRFEDALQASGQSVPNNIRALSKKADAIVAAHERDFKTNRALYDTGKKTKSELTRAAERLQFNLTGIKQMPSSGGERVWISTVMDQTRQLLEQQGIKLTNADLQAVLWYPEKELYEKLGGRASEGINVNYAQVWRDFIKKRGAQ